MCIKADANERLAQVLFFEGDQVCDTSYADRHGKYQKLVGSRATSTDSRESIGLNKKSGVKYHFRTTWVKPPLDEGDIAEIKRTLSTNAPYRAQRFVVEHAINNRLGQVARKEYSEFPVMC